MTPDDPRVPDDDVLAAAARGALGRIANTDDALAPWSEVRARGRRVQAMRFATVAAACLLVVLVGVGVVSATSNNGDHVDVAGVDPGGTSTTSTSTSTTSTTTTTTAPPPTTPDRGTTPPVIPTFPEAQAADFDGTLQVESTTLVATEPMPVTLTLRNITDHVVWVPDLRTIGAYLGFFAATGMTESRTLFAPGESRTFTSTITANPALIGNARLSAAVMSGVALDFGTIVNEYLSAVPPIDVTVIPPGWAPGQPLDPSQGTWSVELSSDVDQISFGDSLIVHAKVTNTGTAAQRTSAYGILAVDCSEAGDGKGLSLSSMTIAPGDQATVDVTAEANSTKGQLTCRAGVMFPTYDGSAVGDFAGATWVYPFPGITSEPLTIPVTGESSASTTTVP
jgi:hypothetical protein